MTPRVEWLHFAEGYDEAFCFSVTLDFADRVTNVTGQYGVTLVTCQEVKYREAEIFGQTIRQARHDRRWTQEELAERAGLTATYVGQIERGDKIPSLTVILKLARGFAIAPSRFLEAFSLAVLRNIEL